ncbi:MULTISPECIES: DNA primase [Streptomyces]|uniref:DNA primase n=1 Tax=Streptomyces thermogriseus TaxID=75292 RepID=A0ABP4DH66_9ACTN|nr:MULTISPECIES: DNA primase [unclassified Streptomyces]MDN5380931.1 DNA primase [Streptomyces sp. LB8]
MNRMGLGLAIGAGYLLGRTKKAKLALAVGSMVAGKKLNLGPGRVAELVNQQLKDNPQIKEIGDQLRQDLRGVGKAASGAMVERQMTALADRLHGRTSQVRDQLAGAVPKTGEAGETGEDGEAGEERTIEGEAEYEDREGREAEEEPESADEPEGEADEPEEEAEEPEEPGDEPARRTAAKKAAAKKPPAKKTAKKAPAGPPAKKAAKKAPAKKTAKKKAAVGDATRAARSRPSKGGGDR